MSQDRGATDVETGDREPAGDTSTGGVSATVLERLIDRAVAGSSTRATAQVTALRRNHPGASTADLVGLIERRFRRRVRTVSAVVGLTAAVPGIGTTVALVLTGTNIITFLRESSTFVGTLCDVHGVALEDVERRRALLLTCLLGESGARAVASPLGPRTLYRGRGVLTRLPLSTVRTVNRGLSRRVVRLLGAKGGTLALGRLAPFGIGAVVGWYLGGRLAGQVIGGARDAFGPASDVAGTPRPA